MDSNADADNLNLSCGENDMGDELKIGADETYDTRSEVSSSGSDSDTTQPSISSVSTKSSRGDNKRNRRSRGKRARSRDSDKSSSPEPKRARSKESKGIAKNYDYTTKLNYLFRDARFDINISSLAKLILCGKMKKKLYSDLHNRLFAARTFIHSQFNIGSIGLANKFV